MSTDSAISLQKTLLKINRSVRLPHHMPPVPLLRKSFPALLPAPRASDTHPTEYQNIFHLPVYPGQHSHRFSPPTDTDCPSAAGKRCRPETGTAEFLRLLSDRRYR